jgi:hypothetical protein
MTILALGIGQGCALRSHSLENTRSRNYHSLDLLAAVFGEAIWYRLQLQLVSCRRPGRQHCLWDQDVTCCCYGMYRRNDLSRCPGAYATVTRWPATAEPLHAPEHADQRLPRRPRSTQGCSWRFLDRLPIRTPCAANADYRPAGPDEDVWQWIDVTSSRRILSSLRKRAPGSGY